MIDLRIMSSVLNRYQKLGQVLSMHYLIFSTNIPDFQMKTLRLRLVKSYSCK